MAEGISRTSNVLSTHTDMHLKCQIVRTFGVVAGDEDCSIGQYICFSFEFSFTPSAHKYSRYRRAPGHRHPAIGRSDSSEPTFFLVSFFWFAPFLFYCCVAIATRTTGDSIHVPATVYQKWRMPFLSSHTWVGQRSERNGTRSAVQQDKLAAY